MPDDIIYKHREVVSYDYFCKCIIKDEEIQKWLKEVVDVCRDGVRLDPTRIFKLYPFKDDVEVTLSCPSSLGMFSVTIPKAYFTNFVIEFESDRDYAFFKIKYM